MTDTPQDPSKAFQQTMQDAAEFNENFSQAWTKGQEAWTQMLAAQTNDASPQNPDPFNLAPAYADFMKAMTAHPEKLAESTMAAWGQYAQLWQTTMTRAMGGDAAPVIEPAKGDKRFDDPEWRSNAAFDHLKQSYLLASQWTHDTLGAAEDLPDDEARKLRFFSERFIESMSPTNFFASNPAALRETVQTKGANLVKGVDHLLEDIQRGGGAPWISQVDMDAFTVGENVAATPGAVIYQNDVMQVIQYAPAPDAEEVYERPLLFLPPWINKYYILDLNAQKSMVRWLVAQGYTVFMTSWRNPQPGGATKQFDDYITEGFFEALDVALQETGADKANVVGYCIGGTMTSTALAYMGKIKDDRVASATLFTAQTDFELSGELKVMVDETIVNNLEEAVKRDGGVLGAQHMAQAFNMMRGSELIWNFVVNNYYLGKEPAAFDMLYWNSDATRMPGGVHIDYLRNFYIANKLSKGDYVACGEQVSLSDVAIPIYSVACREDHIAPAASVYRGADLFGGDVRLVISGSGHIAGVINPPERNRYQYWTTEAPRSDWPETVEQWIEAAEETPGSWWPHWNTWLADKSGDIVPARVPGAKHGVLEAAPGSYVRERSDAPQS